MSVETEDGFQKELVELFVQEAQEWLQQIHVALDELQQAPASDRHRTLAQTIKVGLTNLGGSAATINLSDVERASFSALPFVDAVEDPSSQISADDFLALCKQLGYIHVALTRATGVTFEAESVQASCESPPTLIQTNQLLTLLRGLQERSKMPNTVDRHLVQTMVAQAEGLLQRGMEQCNVASLQEFLDRSGEGEQGFLRLVQEETPHVTAVLHALKSGHGVTGTPSVDLPKAVEQAAQMWSAAQQVNASHAMTFFMGLHSFLTIVAQRRVAVSEKNYETVQSRLTQSMKVIEEWVESGRAERVAIQGVLLS